ncbi:MAG TPA: type I secretion C-terminal target domain-containing protein, partial [Pseudomonas sp.]|nr:type I secretion C-terminal target domain-containing protein [Pseudomonas sp.]
ADESVDPVTLSLGEGEYIKLVATATDGDGDSAEAEYDLSNTLYFEDDGPLFHSVMDAVLSSATTIAFNGLYNASFGADGLDFLSVALGEGGTYGGESVSFVQSDTAEPGTFKVDVTNGANEVLFSFYYTTTTNAVSDGGDGSVEFHAFSSLTDPAGSPFFELTINPDGTYTFEMISNEVISSTTVNGEDFSAFGPIGEVSTDDLSLTIRGSDNVNASDQGIGVKTPKIDAGEWLEMDFAKSQTLVSFTLQQWTGGAAVALLAISFDGDLFDFNTAVAGDQSLSTLKGTERITVIVDADLAGTWAYNAGTKTYTIYVDSEFTELRLTHEGGNGFNINDITYDQITTIEDLTLNFELAVTDGDGDMSVLDDELTVTMLDPEAVISATEDGVDADNGVVLVGNGSSDTLIGGEGDDILIGELDNDNLTGNGGADTFVFAEAGVDHADVITDYSFADGDKIDLGALLDANFGVVSSTVTDFVQITEVVGGATLQVDVDGSGGDFVEVATLENVSAGDKVMLLIGGQEHEYIV